MSVQHNLYDCPVCERDPWTCTCLSKERARRIAYVIGYPAPVRIVTETPAEELVPVAVPRV
jgi:hypothetical protein